MLGSWWPEALRSQNGNLARVIGLTLCDEIDKGQAAARPIGPANQIPSGDCSCLRLQYSATCHA